MTVPKTLLLVLTGLAACARQGAPRSSSEPRLDRPPLLSLVEDPGIVMGDDRVFLFALYDDGTLIHARPRSTWSRDEYRASKVRYVRTKLTDEEKTALLRRLRPEELQSLPKRFEHTCDWPSTIPLQTICEP